MDRSDPVTQATAECFGVILSDAVWQEFGYRKRPSHGRVFQKLRSASKVSTEKRLMQEMAALWATAIIKSGDVAPERLSDFARMLVGSGVDPRIAESFGFNSAAEGFGVMKRAIETYCRLSRVEWAAEFCQRVCEAVPADKELRARVTAGSLRFTMTAESRLLSPRRM